MRRVLCVLFALALAACSGEGEAGGETSSADTLTRRERDSIIANSRIPGAGAVGRAMGAADRASARARVEDSVAASPR